ncbi:TPA: restriction endonuclease subunit S [Photobacterium damselae]
MVPNGWNKKKLTSLCDKIAVGLAISVTPYMASSGVKLIRNQNIKRNYFNTKSVVYITDEFATKNNSKRVYKGDVVAVRTGSNIGEACVVPTEFDGALTFTTLIARPKVDKLNSDYLSTHINSEYGVAEVQRLMAGGGKPNLNSGELKNYTLLTPPLPEQRKIAQILSTWDRGIATTEKLINTSKQQKKALMQLLLTGKKRLVDPETGKAFEGEWETEQFDKLFDIEIGGTPSRSNETYWDDKLETNNNWLSIADLKGKFISRTKERISDLGVAKSNVSLIPKGTIVMSFKLTIGRRAFLNIDTYTNEAICALLIKNKDKLDNNYLYQALEIVDFEQEIDQAVKGKTLNKAKLKRLKLLMPSVKEQQKIASVLTAADKDIELLEAKLAHLKQEKKALMQQLLTGKRRVNIAEIKVATEETLEAEVA